MVGMSLRSCRSRTPNSNSPRVAPSCAIRWRGRHRRTRGPGSRPPTKTAEQLDLHALHRVRERLGSQRTGIINQIRPFMLERRIAVRQGRGFLRTELPTILATRTDALSPRMLRVIEELAGDWRRLGQRIHGLSREHQAL